MSKREAQLSPGASTAEQVSLGTETTYRIEDTHKKSSGASLSLGDAREFEYLRGKIEIHGSAGRLLLPLVLTADPVLTGVACNFLGLGSLFGKA